MSWNSRTQEWTPDTPSDIYHHLLFTSFENLKHVVDWLKKTTPPWKVYVYCFEEGDDVVSVVKMVAALEYQSWGMLLVTPEHHKKICQAEFPIYDYLDSRMRVPVWMR